MLVATTNDLPGHRIVRHIGMVRGVTVRSRNLGIKISGNAAYRPIVAVRRVL